MKVVVFGATGLIGHKLYQMLRNKIDTIPVCRSLPTIGNDDLQSAYRDHATFISDITDETELRKLLQKLNPDYLINCVGVINRTPQPGAKRNQIYINAMLPHLLAEICRDIHCRLIHFSTDCVFSGKKGGYSVSDEPDPVDVYGQTKILGELSYSNCITLRTSFIGHELNSYQSLIDWFLSNKPGTVVNGYVNAIYSGFPTIYLVKIIEKILTAGDELSGVYHLSTEPISKYDLLLKIKEVYGYNIHIEPYSKVKCDRSLKSKQLTEKLSLNIPDWDEMVENMYEDFITTGYQDWKEYFLTPKISNKSNG